MSAFAVLLAAHAIGDYVFQTAASIAEKRQKRLRSWRFWRHIAGHGLLAALALALAEVPPGRALLIGALSAALHGVVDWAKVAVDPRLPERSPWKVRAYLLDQTLHVLTAYALAATTPATPDPALLVASAWIALVLLSTAGIGHAIGMYLARFGEVPGEEGLPGAGFQIGTIERLLVVVFVVLQVWEAVGFLLTAKSIFRFGDIQRAQSRALTEYVLIGTLVSVGGAALLALLFQIGLPLGHW